MQTECIRITRVRAAHGGAHVLVEVKTGEDAPEVLTLLAARLPQLPVCGEISAEVRSFLREGAGFHCALELGLRALGRGGLSKAALVSRLQRRDVSQRIAYEVAAELAARGFMDESAGALAEARQCARKLWGNRRILLQLRAKGYGEDACREALGWLENEDAVARCTALISRRYAGIPEDEAARERLVARLVRYGYTPKEIKAAMKNAWRD